MNGILGVLFFTAILAGLIGAFAGSPVLHALASLVAIVALFGLVSRWIDNPSERRTK
jgi:uncharacterized membrane protein YeaQ/YmgE (transglycosylase-associated protein family)